MNPLNMKKHTTLAIVLALGVITLAVYSRAVFSPFSLIDDSDYVVNNNYVNSELSIHSIKWAFTSFHASNWHPITWLSLMLDNQLFGLNPIGYHLVNIVLHTVNTILLFLLFLLMTGARWRSAFVAACFALHPLHVESVAWITERKDVLSTLFFILTLISYVIYTKQSMRRMYILCLVVFAIGLMTKPMLVTMPVVLLLLDLWPLERFKWPLNRSKDSCGKDNDAEYGCSLKLVLLEKLPFLILSIVSSIITLYAQSDTVQTFVQLSVYKRVCNALWTIVAYMRKMFVPIDLAVFYPYAPVQFWKTAVTSLLLSGILLLVVKYYKRFPWLAFGWFWFLVTLLPVLGLIQAGSQSMADRYTYIPLIGLFTIMSWGGGEFCKKLPEYNKIICSAAAGVLLILSVFTWVQLGYWRDNVSLASHAIKVTDDNYFAYFSLGRAYEKQGKVELAIKQYQEALRINPNDANTHVNLGSILNNQGRIMEAIGHFEEAVTLIPRLADAHYSLGVALGKIGRIDEAISEYNTALMIEPDNIMYHNNIGTELAKLGKFDEAIKHFLIILQLSPNNVKARNNLELASNQRKQMYEHR